MKEVLVLLLPILVLARLRWKDRRVWFLGLLLFVILRCILPASCRACYLSLVWLPAIVFRSPSTVVFSLQRSGPVFIKLGQWLSTRRDLFSDDVCDAMSELHEHVPISSERADRRAVREFEGLVLQEPMGGGCVAQVYNATLDGHPVAVKVRRDGITELLEMDLNFLRLAARWVEFLRPKVKWMALNKAIDNFAFYMMQQVNLTQEAEYMQLFDRNFQKRSNVQVPVIYESNEKVLVMDIAQGVSLSQFVKQNHSHEKRLEVHRVLTDMMAKMGLQDRLLHGDLHPGNLFVDLVGPEEKPIITLIDMGISIKMTPQLGDFTKEAMLAAFRHDAIKLGEAVVKLHERENLTQNAVNLTGLAEEVGYLLLAGCFMVDEKIWRPAGFKSFEDYNGTLVSQYFTMLMTDLTRHRVRVAPDLWSIMTAFALIEGSISELGFGVNVLGACIAYLKNPLNIMDHIRSHNAIRESDKNSRAAGRKS